MRIVPILGTVVLAACSAPQGAGTPSPAASVATPSQTAAYAVETAYSVAAQAELGFAKVATPAQLAAMQQADAAAYAWVVTLRDEAQANVIASDLAAGQQAVAALSALVKAAP